jgi:hypothetical protein
MRLKSWCERPVVHGIWGWVAGWIHDIWLDLSTGRVAAFEICEANGMQYRYVEPFALRQSSRYGLGIDADPGNWQLVEREMSWASLRTLEQVAVVSADGEWTCVITDADCDPETWQLTSLRIQRHWWELFAKRTLCPDQFVGGGADVLLVKRPNRILAGF